MTINTNDQIQIIELSDLEYVTGGGKWSALWDGLQAAGKFIGDGAQAVGKWVGDVAPVVGRKVAEAAGRAAIPVGAGALLALGKHQSD